MSKESSSIDVNLDQLQKQINEAENYLEGLQTSASGSLRESSSGALRSSLRSDSSTPATSAPVQQPTAISASRSVDSGVRNNVSLTRKYSDPKERQNLIDRLLADHAQRSGRSDSLITHSEGVGAGEDDTLYFQRASAHEQPVPGDPVAFFAGDGPREELSSVDYYHSGVGSQIRSSTPSGNQFTPSARYAAWELADHIEKADQVRLDEELLPRIHSDARSGSHAGNDIGDDEEEEEDDAEHNDTLFFASDLPAPLSRLDGGSSDPFMETTYFGRLPTPPAPPRAESRHEATATVGDESLMDTVRFTKPFEPSVRDFSLSQQSDAAASYIAPLSGEVGKASGAAARSASLSAPPVRRSANARIEGNRPAESTHGRDMDDAMVSPKYVEDSKYDTMYSSQQQRNLSTAPEAQYPRGRSQQQQQRQQQPQPQPQGTKLSPSSSRGSAIHQPKQQQKSPASTPVEIKTTAAMRARLKYNQEKHLKKKKKNDAAARGSFDRDAQHSGRTREKLTSTGAVYGFGRSESPPRIRISSKSSARSGRDGIVAGDGEEEESSPRKHHLLKTRSEVQQEVDDEFNESHPFQPTFYTAGSPQTPDSLAHGHGGGGGGDDAGDATIGQRKMRLAPRGVARYMQPRRSTLRSQEAAPKKQPQLPADPFAQAAKMKELHSSRHHFELERSRQKEMMQQLELEECTFHPKIARGSERILQQNESLKQIDVDIKHFVRSGEWHEEAKSKSKSRSRSRTRSESPAPRKPLAVSEQLYQDAQIRAAQQNWVREQVKRARDAQYTYQPVINPSTDAIVHTRETEYKPIHERLADIQREKKEYMQRLKHSIEEEQSKQASFRPTLSQRSTQLALRKRTSGLSSSPSPQHRQRQRSASRERLTGEAEAKQVLGFHNDVSTRLLDAGRVLARKKQMLANKHDDEVADTMEQAVISDGSRKILRDKGMESKRFEERQQDFKRKQRENMLQMQKEEESRMQRFFKPSIVRKSEEIVNNQHPDRLLETIEMRVKRLSVDEYEAIEQRRRQRAAELYGSITFKPTIDPISKALGRSATVDELADPSYHQHARQRVQKELDERYAKECTYQPQINPLSKKLMEYTDDNAFIKQYHQEFGAVGWSECPVEQMQRAASLGDDSQLFQRHHLRRVNMKEPERMSRDIRLHLIEKEEKRRQELMAREIQELSTCTFRPRIEESMSGYERMKRSSSPVVVRGLGRHMELRYLSEKKREDKKQREEEVFSVPNVDQYRRAADGSTIVQSFTFGSAADRSMNASRMTVSNGCPELQMDYLTLPTSHRMQNASETSAAAWVM